MRSQQHGSCPKTPTDSLAAPESNQAPLRPGHECASSRSSTSSVSFLSSGPPLRDSLPGNKACREVGRNCSCFTFGREASCQAGASWRGLQACACWAGWAQGQGGLRPSRRPGEGTAGQPFCLSLFSVYVLKGICRLFSDMCLHQDQCPPNCQPFLGLHWRLYQGIENAHAGFSVGKRTVSDDETKSQVLQTHLWG